MDIAKLAFEDGTVYAGRAFGARGEIDGKVVFNTSMTGYQEILTDPSYHGQIVTMTYPLIGNYGVNREDAESGKPSARRFVVRELSRSHGNQRAESSLEDYMIEHNVVGIEGVNTRAIVRRTRREGGAQRNRFDRRSRRQKPGRKGAKQSRLDRPRFGERGNADRLETLGSRLRKHVPRAVGDDRKRDRSRKETTASCRRARFRHEVEHSASFGGKRLRCDGPARFEQGRRSA